MLAIVERKQCLSHIPNCFFVNLCLRAVVILHWTDRLIEVIGNAKRRLGPLEGGRSCLMEVAV